MGVLMMHFKAEVTPEQKLYELIDKVVIVKGRVSTDITVWEFYINDKILRVETDRLENPKSFRQQYLKVFDRPAPKIKSDGWIELLDALAEEKVQYAEAPEESENVFIANQILEIVSQYEVSDDPEDAVSGLALLKYEFGDDKKTYFCMLSSLFLNLVSELGFKIPPNILSDTMTQLGLKRKGTPRIYYSGKQMRSWCFIPEAIEGIRGDSHYK